MDNSPRRGWYRRVLDIVGAACAALLAFTAVPIVLVVIVGNPLGGGLGHDWRPLPQAALCSLVLAAWVAWAACCAQLLRAVVAHVRTGEVGPRRSASVLDRVAARIAFGVLALTSFGTPLSLAAGANAPEAHASVTATAPLPRGTGTGTGAVATSVRVSALTYTVRSGDTLWRIAAEQLGDGADWTSLARLNLGRDFGGGTHFIDPDQLREGWRLRLPSEARRGTDDRGRNEDTGHPATSPESPGHLPELVALGLGSVACAALARRARRRRRLGARFSADPMLQPALSEGAQDAGTLLQRFDGVPALRLLEAANSLLGLALEGHPLRPKVRAICVSPSGVTFCFTTAQADEPPHGFERSQGGAAWHVSHDTLESHDPCFPLLPVMLPIGDDDEGTWLVPLEPGDVLPLLGEAAPALWRAARAAAGSWTWAEIVLITEDPDDPALRAETLADPSIARHVLFCGDPAALPPEAVGRCAVVTMDPVAASNLTVLVDRHAATLHPMGLVVRPHLQSSATAQHIAELIAPLPGPEEGMPDGAPHLETGGLGGGLSDGAGQGAGALSPGTVDVRLLTMTPRIDGLNEDLPPNRARRAVELVAYLALHQPDVVTSDRLRTRVLGSSDADAAAKTLFNTAYAARRALGVDEQGDPLFPAGTRQGLYQLSPHVTVDVQRAATLAAEGKVQSDPTAAIAYFRAALELVEGEPLANALSGYAWWEAEGHGGRIAAVLVDAACLMATLAADARLFELARWGLEQARVVEPYSEALSRAAMQVAAAEGDADRLRLEWRDCQRRIDSLDPGSSPSARTEALYVELSRRVLVGVALADDGTPRSGLDVGD